MQMTRSWFTKKIVRFYVRFYFELANRYQYSLTSSLIDDHVIQDQEFEHVKRVNASNMTYRLILSKSLSQISLSLFETSFLRDACDMVWCWWMKNIRKGVENMVRFLFFVLNFFYCCQEKHWKCKKLMYLYERRIALLVVVQKKKSKQTSTTEKKNDGQKKRNFFAV